MRGLEGSAQGRGRKHKAPKSFTVAQLLDQWLEWRETNGKAISPSTLYNCRLTVATKIKPGLGHLAVADVDARILDCFYAALRKSGNARFPQSRGRGPERRLGAGGGRQEGRSVAAETAEVAEDKKRGGDH